MAITKSLHTVTSATNVARHLARNADYRNGIDLARASLAVLGYEYTTADMARANGQDPTIGKIVNACTELLKR